MPTYNKAVENNLRHMGTALHEWTALPFIMVEADGKTCPQVDWRAAAGMGDAPTLYKQGGDSGTCELCGHKIKNCYGAINTEKGWKLTVGSECVGHLTGTPGEVLAKSAAKDAANEAAAPLLARIVETKKLMEPQKIWFPKSYVACLDLIDSAQKALAKGNLGAWYSRNKAKIDAMLSDERQASIKTRLARFSN